MGELVARPSSSVKVAVISDRAIIAPPAAGEAARFVSEAFNARTTFRTF